MTTIQAKRQLKKSVSFGDENNTIHTYDARATDILWEWPESFDISRVEARRAGRKLRDEGIGEELLENCFCNNRDDIQKSLNEWARIGSGRGVERFACKAMNDERKEERYNAIKAVMIGQTQARENGLSQDVMAEQLREVSLIYCLNAKVFARRIGKADEAACYPKKRSSGKRSKSSSSSICSVSSHTTLSTAQSSVTTSSPAA